MIWIENLLGTRDRALTEHDCFRHRSVVRHRGKPFGTTVCEIFFARQCIHNGRCKSC